MISPSNKYRLPSGVLVIDKPAGITSHDVVDRVRRLIRSSTGAPAVAKAMAGKQASADGRRSRLKVGHAGTLDPFATGVLVVALGSATRLIQFTQHRAATARPAHQSSDETAPNDWLKTYDATIRLGATSTTDDLTGEIHELQSTNKKQITDRCIKSVLSSFVGTTQQMPPAFSARQVKGERAYKKARVGERVMLQATPIYIESITLLAARLPELLLRIHCGTGTYIRALARDIGQKLAVGAYCTTLRRIAVGPLDIRQALPLANLSPHNFPQVILPPEILVGHFQPVVLPIPLVDQFRQGKVVRLAHQPSPRRTDVAVFSNASLQGVGTYDPITRALQPKVVFR